VIVEKFSKHSPQFSVQNNLKLSVNLNFLVIKTHRSSAST
jgi:hypothetical protein